MELIIFIGLQACGKTTFFHKHFAATHQHISKDLMRNNKNRARRQTQMIEEAFQTGHSVVVDNTIAFLDLVRYSFKTKRLDVQNLGVPQLHGKRYNSTIEDRASLIELGNTYGTQIIGYYFESKIKDCLERNQQRSGKARVPDVGLYATRTQLVRPSYAEGFHQLFYVGITNNSTFNLSVWTETKIANSKHKSLINFKTNGVIVL